jgi:hypothetical protein
MTKLEPAGVGKQIEVRRPRKQGNGMNTSPNTDPITRTEDCI